MKKLMSFCLLIIILSMILTSCNHITSSEVVSSTSLTYTTERTTTISNSISAPKIIPAGNSIKEWQSKMLVDNMVFGNGVAATIDGKNYLICSVNTGTNPEGAGTSADTGIVVLDITDPETPNEVSYLKTGSDKLNQFIRDLKLNGAILYALTYDSLWIVDLSDPNHPEDVGEIALTEAMEIEIAGKYAYITSNPQTGGDIITTYDISDTIHPRNIGEITMQASIGALKTSGSLLLALAMDGLHLYDKSSPGFLKQIALFPETVSTTSPTAPIPPEHIPSGFFDMDVIGNYVYIMAGIDRLLAVDISNPAAPKLVSDFATWYQGNEILISGEMAYVLSSDGPVQFSEHFANLLESVNITNPVYLNELPSVQLEPTYQHSYSTMILASNHLYFCDNRYPILQILDLTDLTDLLK